MTIRQKRHKLLTTTAALSVAFGSIAPLPSFAQDTPGATTPPPVVAPSEDMPEAETPNADMSDSPSAEADAPATDTQGSDAPEMAEPESDTPEADAPPEPAAPAEQPATNDSPATPPAATEIAPDIAPDGTPPEIAPVEPDPSEPEAPVAEPASAPEAEPAPTPEAAPEPQTSAPASEPQAAPETTAAPEAEAPADTQSEPTTTEPTTEAVNVLDTILGGAGLGAATGAAASDAPDSDATEATTTQITEEDARTSDEDFATTASGEQRSEQRDRGGLSDLQKAGLLALGGLTVGALLGNGNEVVSNTGDRVVVRQNDGNYTVLKDDDALLRQPGSTVRTENFTDGSTRSTVEYADGSRVVTVRDASGRVLRRERIDPVGQQVRLFDDTTQAAPVDTSLLPRAREDVRVSPDDRTGLREALARIEARDNARAYSLSQIRDYRQVRALAPVVDVDNITFRSGSAAVDASQAEQLSDLGNLMRDMINENPAEVFLIEGHTDATGSDSANLALSDRRAESVALALTEYFDVPPENLIVQGYGESDLRIDTQRDEPRNRRVAVRIITPLLQSAQAR